MTGEPLEISVALPKLFLALTASLREPSRSPLAIDELLATIVQFLLLKPSTGNEISVSDLEAEISGLTALALAGNQRAILAASAAFARSGGIKGGARQFILSLVQMMALEDQKFLKDSMEVLTVLLNEGYSLQGYHAKSVMDAIVVIIRAIYAGQLFAEDAPLSWSDKEKVIYAAFDLLEALCANKDNWDYLTNTGIFETITPNDYTTQDIDDQAKVMIDKIDILRAQHLEAEPESTGEPQYDDEELVEEEDGQEEDGQDEDGQEEASDSEDNSEDTSQDEDETEETSP
ncbi:hypothetical protein FRC09_004131 [Ceratobasidium sp. 395]|nr:hypothetical protein FRC09_004131 [Ceratobasidium sp. 395]